MRDWLLGRAESPDSTTRESRHSAACAVLTIACAPAVGPSRVSHSARSPPAPAGRPGNLRAPSTKEPVLPRFDRLVRGAAAIGAAALLAGCSWMTPIQTAELYAAGDGVRVEIGVPEVRVENLMVLAAEEGAEGRSEEHTSELQSRGHLV